MQLWIIGGPSWSTSVNSSYSSEIVDDTGSIKGPALPWSISGYCATTINSTHVIITGGSKSLIVNHNDNWKITIGLKYRKVRQSDNHRRNLGYTAH